MFAARWQTKYLRELPLLLQYPASLTRNPSPNLVGVGLEWGDDLNEASRMNANREALHLAAFKPELDGPASVLCFADHWRSVVS